MRVLLLITTFLMAGVLSAEAQDKEVVTLTIEVDVTKYNKGSIYVALYNSKDTYMEKSYKSIGEKVNDHKVRLTFENIEKGSYAFSLFHDVNDNKKIDKNFFGIPKEPYLFSNNLKGRFGPPKFEKAKFHLDENQTINVSVK